MLARVFAAFFLLLSAAHAQDIAGAREQGIARFQGSTIIGYQAFPYGGFRLPIGPMTQDDLFEWHLNAIEIEGKITGFVYRLPPGKTTLEVFRNYQKSIAAAGFQPLFACESDETCGSADVLVQKLYTDAHVMHDMGIRSAQAVIYGSDIRYLSAKRSVNGVDSYVSLAVAKETTSVGGDTDSLSIILHIIEPTPMAQSMVVVDAAKMATDIGATGHIALYGIYFDTGSAEIKAESEPTLAQIATLLKQNANRKVAIVGHTDTVGGYDFNMNLSSRRAKSVVDTLIKRYGIVATRLRAAGVGFLAPVASNETDDGRAKNRRVELVQE